VYSFSYVLLFGTLDASIPFALHCRDHQHKLRIAAELARISDFEVSVAAGISSSACRGWKTVSDTKRETERKQDEERNEARHGESDDSRSLFDAQPRILCVGCQYVCPFAPFWRSSGDLFAGALGVDLTP
jgi:hypothetical protein